MATLQAIEVATTASVRRHGSLRTARPASAAPTIPELLGFASHELSGPLATILASTKLIELSPAADHQALVETITHEAHRMTATVGNLLTYARLQRGHPLESEPVLLGRTVETAVGRYCLDHPSASIKITVERGLTVEADASDIEHILGNYLGNALKYGLGQPIRVEVRRKNRFAVVSVLDRGPGIAKVDLRRVFEPFYRVAATAKGKPGLGLGLALCRWLVEGYGGRTWTQPRRGGGAIFAFSLPLAASDPIRD